MPELIPGKVYKPTDGGSFKINVGASKNDGPIIFLCPTAQYIGVMHGDLYVFESKDKTKFLWNADVVEEVSDSDLLSPSGPTTTLPGSTVITDCFLKKDCPVAAYNKKAHVDCQRYVQEVVSRAFMQGCAQGREFAGKELLMEFEYGKIFEITHDKIEDAIRRICCLPQLGSNTTPKE